MNSQKGLVIPLILAILAILAIGGGVFVYQNKKVEAPAVVQNTATTTDETKDWKTYTNTKYNFSFDYPKTGLISENSTKDNITIYSGTSTEMLDNDRKLEAFSVNFKIINNDSFGQQNTKVGEIIYDMSLKALVDKLGTPRCLQPKMLGDSLPAFLYGGSSMSTPAHWEYAVLTNQNYMILVSEFIGTNNTDLIVNKDKISSSLSFINGVQVRTPECVK